MTAPASIAEDFEAQAGVTQIMSPELYRATLEFLVANGIGVGKTKPVAAYFFNPDQFFNREGERGSFAGDESGGEKEQKIEVKPLYIIMDLSMWAEENEYARRLCIKKIFEKLAESIYTEQDINNETFEAPGVWTAKAGTFKQDYFKRAGTNIWCPNADAHRICVQLTEEVTIPTYWGTQTVRAGGMIAAYERDFQEIAAALLAIRSGSMSIEEALYKTDDNGALVARFDVYGMDPGFCEHNYSPVALKDETVNTRGRFSGNDDAKLPVQTFDMAKNVILFTNTRAP